MKKTLMTCVAIAALLAIAGTAGAITCTVDQRPAATLLVPYFQVSAGAAILNDKDTLVTIANASSAPMIAHVNVWDRFSRLRLDFNIALTGFDVQAMRMSDIISGNLPNTPNDLNGVPTGDVCQRECPPTGPGCPPVYPAPGGFIRVIPISPATNLDNSLATTAYSGTFFSIVDELRADCDGVLGDLAIGYITIDHVNYCNLSDPSDPNYYNNDAIGMENNLWGEIIFTSSLGIPTYGMSTVNLEADPSLGTDVQPPSPPIRTFYARYWSSGGDTSCTNNPALLTNAPWDCGFGDQREPLGLKYAARWFDIPGITSNFRVWRSSPTVDFPDFCTIVEPEVALTFFDEDEESVNSGPCPSPCVQQPFNFPLETNQRNISEFRPLPNGGAAGWVNMSFVNNTTGNVLDQAWVDYSFEGILALETIMVPGTQLDPSTCNPLGVSGIQVIVPAIPVVVGSGP